MTNTFHSVRPSISFRIETRLNGVSEDPFVETFSREVTSSQSEASVLELCQSTLQTRREKNPHREYRLIREEVIG
jgi:hypothetical protein